LLAQTLVVRKPVVAAARTASAATVAKTEPALVTIANAVIAARKPVAVAQTASAATVAKAEPAPVTIASAVIAARNSTWLLSERTNPDFIRRESMKAVVGVNVATAQVAVKLQPTLPQTTETQCITPQLPKKCA
jgi:hypothetical protein